MTNWQNLQIGITVNKLSGIEWTEGELDSLARVITQAFHDYYNGDKDSKLPVEHFAEFTTINAELQPFAEPQHVIEIKGEYDWTLQHPLNERPDLMSCPYNTALKAVGGKEPGKYFCTLEVFGKAESATIPPTPVVILGERIDT